MNAKLKVRIPEEAAADNRNFHEIIPDKGYGIGSALNGGNVINDPGIHEAAKKERTLAATAGMFLAAPFLGLAFVIALPLIGFYHVAKLALEAFARKSPVKAARFRKAAAMLKNVGLFFAAPIVALGYIIALPFVGLVMIAKLANEARMNRGYASS